MVALIAVGVAIYYPFQWAYDIIGWGGVALVASVWVVGIGIVLRYWFAVKEKKRETDRREELEFRANLKKRQFLTSLSPHRFEEAVARILESNGYRVSVTPQSGDLGVDVVAERGGRTFVVQVKQYASGTSIGRPDLQRLQGAMLHLRAHGMIFVTIGHFSAPAVEYAKQNGIRLIDGDELVAMAGGLNAS